MLAEAIACHLSWTLAPLLTRLALRQEEPDSCAAVAQAPAHFVYKMHEALLDCGPHLALVWGGGGLNEHQQAQLEALLVEKGAPSESVGDRVKQAMSKLSPSRSQEFLATAEGSGLQAVHYVPLDSAG